jgi:glycosyltransferase involved in cell wall biosynthesis
MCGSCTTARTTSRPRRHPTSPPATPHVLFVGDRKAYKNFTAVLDAMTCPDWGGDLPLRVVGPPFSPGEQAEIAARGLRDRIEHAGRLSDSALREAYARAAVFLFPSLMEGFGFPLLEAQAAGAAVAASDTRVFNEIGGPAFERFDPRDPSTMAAAVRSSLTLSRAAELRRLGLENVRRFSWETAARMTGDVWRTYARTSG